MCQRLAGAREADTSLETVKEPSAAAQGLAGPPASLKLLRGDIEARNWFDLDLAYN